MQDIHRVQKHDPNVRFVVTGCVLGMVTYLVVARLVIGASWVFVVTTLLMSAMGTVLLAGICFNKLGDEEPVSLWIRVFAFVVFMGLGVMLDFGILHISLDREQDSTARQQLIDTYVAHWNNKGFALKPENVDMGCSGDTPCKSEGKLGLTNGTCRLVFDIRQINDQIVAIQKVYEEPSGDAREVQMTEEQMQQLYRQYCK